ncbi:MAG: O-antigen ligase family protein [Coriobacteriales bacterium]|nr:O-antigen ligase family protein [Coriobacteriales bacterium]
MIGKTKTLLKKIKMSPVARNQGRILSYYASVSLAVTLLSWIGPFSAIPRIQTMVNSALAVIGLFLLAVNLLTKRSITRVPHYPWFLLFLLSLIVTSIVNIGYGWSENAKTFVWELLQIGLFLPISLLLTKDELRAFFKNTFWVLFLITTASCLVALAEHIFQVGYLFMTADGLERGHGFINARLYGPFINPNTGSPLAILAIAAALSYLRIFKPGKGVRLFIWISNTICWLYTIASASRGGALCALAAFAFLTLFRYLNARHEPQKDRGFIVMRNAVMIGLALSVSFVVIENVSVRYAEWQHARSAAANLGALSPSFSASRQDISAENISNHRFQIWEDFIVFNNDSVLFGKSPRNLIPIIIDLHPDSFTAERQLEPHNSMIHVYAATGLLGVIPWAALTFLLFKELIGYLRRNKTVPEPVVLCVTLLVILCVKATTSNSLLFTFTADNLIFFMVLGYLFNFFHQARHRKETGQKGGATAPNQRFL